MDSPGGKVLIVEDDALMRETLSRALGQRHDVTVAFDGEEALRRFEEGQRFDVVLCDLEMPRVDGPHLIDSLCRLDRDQADRLVVVTGNPEALRTQAHGGSFFVVEKPFSLVHLRRLVDEIVSARQRGYFPQRRSRG